MGDLALFRSLFTGSKRAGLVLVALISSTLTAVTATPAGAASCSSATVNFVGGTNSFWDVASNWDTNAVPLSSDDVCVPTGKTATVRNSSAVAQNVAVDGVLNVTSVGELTAVTTSVETHGTFTLAGGDLQGNLDGAADATVSAWGTISGDVSTDGPFVIGELHGTTARTLNIGGGLLQYGYVLVIDWLSNGNVAGTDYDVVHVAHNVVGDGEIQVDNPTSNKLSEGNYLVPITYLHMYCGLATSALNAVPGVHFDTQIGSTNTMLTARGIPTPTTTTTQPAPPAAPSSQGYWLASTAGDVYGYNAASFGSMAGKALNAPIVDIAATPNGDGYWMVARDGGVFAFGAAAYYGSMGGQSLNAPIVGIASTPDGHGYYLVASDGGVFNFGTAAFAGSTGAMKLNQPVVGIAADSDGTGYWLAAADGGVFAFGAAFNGSAASQKLGGPIVDIAANPHGAGYWLAGSDGGVFNYGTQFAGSAANTKLGGPVKSIAATTDGTGYRLAGSDGGVFSFGTSFLGSATGHTTSSVVGVASFGGGTNTAQSNEPVHSAC